MEQPTVVTRLVDVELPPDELWSLIGKGRGWAEWMVDDADVVVEPGAEGTVTDGAGARGVRIAEVIEGERVAFDWWPAGDEGAVSTVELIIVATSAGSRVGIVETFPAPRSIDAVRASTAWAVRESGLRACSAFLVAA